MKKFSILLLSLATLPVYAQGILGSLTQYQNSLEPKVESTGPGGSSTNVPGTPEVKPSTQTSQSSSGKCEESDQKSLPLSYLASLLMKKDGALDIVHDSRAGKLTISGPDMIGNCSSMLQWNLNRPEIQGGKAYALEVKFKEGESCTANGCVYRIPVVENGEFKEKKEMVLKPTLKGFEECLQKSGVIADGKVVPGAIYPSPVSEKFSGISESGKFMFVSHGPSTPLAKPKYGKFDPIDGCDYYEPVNPNISALLTYEDAEKIRLDAEAVKLKDCTINEYHKVADFLEKYENYNSELGEVRDRLIQDAAKKAAAAIESGKYTEEDLKVIADFDRYIVQPKLELAVAIYNEMIELEGDSKKQKQEELRAVLAKIDELGKKPYFVQSHRDRLMKDGRFDEAEKVNTMSLMLGNYKNLGSKIQGVVITPAVASSRVQVGLVDFKDQLETQKEYYEIRTGQSSGKSQFYAQMASKMKSNIDIRTQNFTAEIQSELMRLQQPNGYCFKYWRNTQKCAEDTMERIQELQMLLQHYNKVDAERAAEYEAKAKEYGELEAEGRRYVAAQNGEEPPQEQPKSHLPQDTVAAPTRPQDAQGQQGYTFNFNGGQQQMNQQQYYQQQAQMMPQQYQQPMNGYYQQNMFSGNQNPYGYQMQMQQPWLGQQSYGQFGAQGYMGAQTGFMQQPYAQQGYNFNFTGGGQQMYQTPQYGYQQNMYGSYNPHMQYGMYGRVGW